MLRASVVPSIRDRQDRFVAGRARSPGARALTCAAALVLALGACDDDKPGGPSDASRPDTTADLLVDRPISTGDAAPDTDAPAAGDAPDAADAPPAADAKDAGADAATDSGPAGDTAPPIDQTGDQATDQTGGGDAAGLPAACRVPSPRPGSLSALIFVRNRSDQTIYLSQQCQGVEFSISSCASRFTDHLGPTFVCACNCADASCTGSIACGACPPPNAIVLAPGGSRVLQWQAVHVVLQSRPTYSCAEHRVLPAAVYSVSVPIYASAAAAATGTPVARIASRTFELTGPGVEVEVVVGGAAGDGGAPDLPPSCETPGPITTCMAPWSPQVPCALDQTYRFGAVGGLRLATEEAKLSPPSLFTLTRTLVSNAEPPRSCSNPLPRCGATHDVFTTADVMEALAAPDVVAAFAQPSGQIYGHDARPYDGTVLSLTRADGHNLLIGSACTPTRTCARPLPAGLERLAAVLAKIEAQQRAAPGCEALRTP